jgi:Pyruvate/2-oxoacid:ferredoxin oxidoreductase delta subunit
MLLDLCQFLSPRLSIMDAVTAMEGNGPGNGDPRQVGLIFAGESPVAVDMAAAAVVGASADDVPLLKAARRMGMVEAEPSNIRVLGEAIEDVRVAGFKFPPLSSTNFTERLPAFLDGPLRKALTGRPHIKDSKCTLCGICVSVCPAEVMENTGRIEIAYDRCIRCYCCQEMCPEGAISVRDGWLKRLIPGL